MHRRTAVPLLTALAASASLTVAAPATAEEVPIASGTTTLRLDAGAARALKGLGVSVAPTGTARATSAGIRFPITTGTLDPTSRAGTIRHSGGLRLSGGGKGVTLSSFTVAARTPATVSAVAGGKRFGAFVLVLGKARITRDGLGARVSNVDLHLSTKGAAALNATFGVTAFKPRLKLGTVTIAAAPARVAFAGGQTDLALDSGAAAALTSLGVRVGGSTSYKITGGEVDAKTLAGEITHSGELTLSAGATTVTLKDFTIDTTAGKLTADVGGTRVPILTLDLAKPELTIKGRIVTVANVAGTLTAEAAGALNTAFGTTALTEGLLIGKATVTGRAQ